MPKPTFHNLPADKRARLVALALEEFSERPFAQASLSRIVERAGIAKGSVYQYFEDKFDMYRWLLTEELARRKLSVMEQARLTPGTGLWEQLGVMFMMGLRLWLQEPRMARLAAHALESSSDETLNALHEELRRASLGYLRTLLSHAQQRGEVRSGVDLDLAVHVVAAVMGRGLVDALMERLGTDMLRFLRDPSLAAKLPEEDVAALVQQAVDLLRRALG